MTWVANRKWLIESLHAKHNHPSTRMFQNTFGTQQPRPHPFKHENQYQWRTTTSASQYNLPNAQRSTNDQSVLRDILYARSLHQHYQEDVANYNQENHNPEEAQNVQAYVPPYRCPRGPCYNISKKILVLFPLIPFLPPK